MLGLNATFRDISLNLTTLSAEISRAVCFCAAFRKAGGGRGPSNSSRSPNAPAGRWTPFTRLPSAPSSATRDAEPEVVGGDIGAHLDGLLHVGSLGPVDLAARGRAGRGIEAEAGSVAVGRARVDAAQAQREAVTDAVQTVEREAAREVAAEGGHLTVHLVVVSGRRLVGGATKDARGAGAAVHRAISDATGDGTERPHDQTVGGPLGDPELVIETAAFRGAPGERHTDDPGAFATPAPCVRERVDGSPSRRARHGGPVALTVRRRDVLGGKGSRDQGPDEQSGHRACRGVR